MSERSSTNRRWIGWTRSQQIAAGWILSSNIKKFCYKITISHIGNKNLCSLHLSAVKPQSMPGGSHVVFSVVGIKIWNAWRY